MTEKDAHAEGFKDLDQFRVFWTKIYGKWNPDEVVWVYEWDPGEVKRANKSNCGARLDGF